MTWLVCSGIVIKVEVCTKPSVDAIHPV